MVLTPRKFNFERVSIFAQYCLCVFEYFYVFLLTMKARKKWENKHAESSESSLNWFQNQ